MDAFRRNIFIKNWKYANSDRRQITLHLFKNRFRINISTRVSKLIANLAKRTVEA